MKTLRNVLACAMLLAGFAACTDDFATLDDRPSAAGQVSVIIDDAKPGDDATPGDRNGVDGDKKDGEDETAATGSEKPGN